MKNHLPGLIMLVLLFLTGGTTTLYAQGRQVGGTVSDETGSSLPGVNVLVKGTNVGTTTDANGRYALEAGPEATALIFSFIGYKSQEVELGGRTVVDVSMAPDIQQLNEVVVVGYGEQKKSDFTGAISSANLEAFRESPNVNVLQSLQGSVPGVQIGQVTSAGQEPTISIRGQTSLGGSTNPLIVLDGSIYRGRIGDLNPADIASIDVLKDPSSMAIYGAQAANGVILITSKKGKTAKKPRISYSGSYATQTPNTDIRLLNREEMLQKVRDVEYKKAYLAPDFTQPDPAWNFSNSELLPLARQGIDDGTNTDWWDEATNPGFISDHRLNLDGGSETFSYYISGGYTEQNGIVVNDKYSRSSIRINLEAEVTDWLTIGTNTFGAFTDFSGVSPDMTSLARTSPFVNIRDGNGEYVINPLGDNNVNPFLIAAADDLDRNNNISGNFFAVIKIPKVKGLSYRLNYNNNYRWDNKFLSNRYAAGLNGGIEKRNSSTNDVLLDNIITYDRRFDDHGLKVTLVAGSNEIEFERTVAEGENVPNISLSYNSLEQAIVQRVNSDAWSEAYVYQMGRINYDYKNRYLLTATVRRDGFSGFSKNNKTAIFPSIGLGWVISEESFAKLPQVDFLKLRASYGRNGNLTGRYSSLARISAGESSRYVFGDGSATSLGFSMESLPNNDLSWELTTGLNVGLDFEILGSRLTGNIEYYRSTTTDLLWNQVLPQVTGFREIRSNLGKIENRGVEFALSGLPVQTEKFSWRLGVNFASNRNRIVELLGLDSDGDGKEDDLIASGLFIGKSIRTIYDFEVDGIWQIADEVPAGFAPGTYRIVDQDGDGTINAQNDRVFLGREEPAYSFGIMNTLQYGQFTFRFFINSIQGGKDGYLGANHPYGVASTTGTAQNQNWYNNWEYWSPTNPDAPYPQPWQVAPVNAVQYLSRSFVRLQDISLAYDFTPDFLKKIGIANAKVFVSGKNLLTMTNWRGWDPETGQGIGLNRAPGQGNDVRQGFPVMRSYSVGVDLSF